MPVGSYVVVTDTIVNGHPVWPAFGPGPAEAVKQILTRHGEFVADPDDGEVLAHLQPGRFPEAGAVSTTRVQFERETVRRRRGFGHSGRTSVERQGWQCSGRRGEGAADIGTDTVLCRVADVLERRTRLGRSCPR